MKRLRCDKKDICLLFYVILFFQISIQELLYELKGGVSELKERLSNVLMETSKETAVCYPISSVQLFKHLKGKKGTASNNK